MNVETVETVTGGTQSDSPDFAQIVNDPAHWEQYGQRTWDATEEGYIYSRISKDGRTPAEVEQKFRDNNATRQPYYGWWGSALLNNDEYEANNINAKFHVVQGGDLNEGFAFAVTKDMDAPYKPIKQDGTVYDNSVTAYPISGYFMTYSHHLSSNENGGTRTLWRIDNWRLDNSFSATGSLNSQMWCYWGSKAPDLWKKPGTTVTTSLGETATCLGTWHNTMDDVDYEIDFRDGRLQVWDTDEGVTTKRVDLDISYDEATGSTSYMSAGTSEKVATVAGKAPLERGTYGFWGNNCEMMKFAQVSKLDIQIEKKIVKSFGDIVYEPTWTDGALHMLINMDTKSDPTMLGKDGGVLVVGTHEPACMPIVRRTSCRKAPIRIEQWDNAF